MRKLAQIGDKYGRLTILSIVGKNKREETLVLCRCDCGNKKTTTFKTMTRGDSLSCGCLAKEAHLRSHQTHRLSNTRTYFCWRNMLNRCANKKVKSYRDYGAKGITVCAKWKTLEGFITDMGKCPKGLTLDRKNPRLGYYKENCRWIPRFQQGENRSNNKVISFNGITTHLAEWARKLGIKYTTLHARLKKHSVEKVFSSCPE